MPGFAPGRGLALLPFWGNWCLADFALASVLEAGRVRIILDEADRNLLPVLSTRWKGRPAEPVVSETGLAGLQRLLAAEDAECVVLAALSAVWLLDPRGLEALVSAARTGLAKASVQGTPIECYAARRDRVLALLESSSGRLGRRRGARELLFSGAAGRPGNGTLDGALELIEELPGELLFLNDLTDLHHRTLRLADNGAEALAVASRLPEMAEPVREARIAERAHVRSSWIAPGAEVEGSVEESVVFPGAVVRRGAQVAHSVVMNGAVIGSGAVVQNALVLPFGDAQAPGGARASATVGERCVVGARGSGASNARFPDHIRDGLAVVGMDVELPAGFRLEGGSLVAPGVPLAELRRLKVLRRGQTAGGEAS